jgi:hypothetical protein
MAITEKVDALQKAKAKSLAAHFKKAAAHHDKMADTHEKCMKAHEGAAAHHEGMMGKEMEMAAKSEDPAVQELQKAADMHKAHHKAKAAFHKTMASHHEKFHKHHSAHADHNRSMAEAHGTDGEAATKALKVLEIDFDTTEEKPVMSKANDGATPTTPNPNPNPAPVVSPTGVIADLNEVIQKALDSKLTEGVAAALERVLASDDFNKKVDNQIAGMLLEKLGTSTVPTEVKTFPVPRDGKPNSAAKTSSTPSAINMDGVDLELQDMCKME